VSWVDEEVAEGIGWTTEEVLDVRGIVPALA
jgi:hypothetical protein